MPHTHLARASSEAAAAGVSGAMRDATAVTSLTAGPPPCRRTAEPSTRGAGGTSTSTGARPACRRGTHVPVELERCQTQRGVRQASTAMAMAMAMLPGTSQTLLLACSTLWSHDATKSITSPHASRSRRRRGLRPDAWGVGGGARKCSSPIKTCEDRCRARGAAQSATRRTGRSRAPATRRTTAAHVSRERQAASSA